MAWKTDCPCTHGYNVVPYILFKAIFFRKSIESQNCGHFNSDWTSSWSGTEAMMEPPERPLGNPDFFGERIHHDMVDAGEFPTWKAVKISKWLLNLYKFVDMWQPCGVSSEQFQALTAQLYKGFCSRASLGILLGYIGQAWASSWEFLRGILWGNSTVCIWPMGFRWRFKGTFSCCTPGTPVWDFVENHKNQKTKYWPFKTQSNEGMSIKHLLQTWCF